MILTLKEIQAELKIISNWSYLENGIEKKFVFKNFKDAMVFINKIAVIAEKMKHHPDWSNVYNKVSIRLTTHDSGGVTKKDFDLARAIDALI
jgi:4a-hydroxytetrahydrobiopterin dehydratase